MKANSIAPCGVICDLCLAFQRPKNTCVGCTADGNKPYHCTVCSIKACPEKQGNPASLCIECAKFPCRRIRNLNTRYTTKYGESPIDNLHSIQANGLAEFLRRAVEQWKCRHCGRLLCVHRETCLHCGARNSNFPETRR
ncbi:MAG: DUF3795 domain-containing protein [Spirochaetia bacterium]|nr:DUF3795 domain-containing protein [Spirochaetia bacterium]